MFMQAIVEMQTAARRGSALAAGKRQVKPSQASNKLATTQRLSCHPAGISRPLASIRRKPL
jgi:hypothetical protein